MKVLLTGLFVLCSFSGFAKILESEVQWIEQKSKDFLSIESQQGLNKTLEKHSYKHEPKDLKSYHTFFKFLDEREYRLNDLLQEAKESQAGKVAYVSCFETFGVQVIVGYANSYDCVVFILEKEGKVSFRSAQVFTGKLGFAASVVVETNGFRLKQLNHEDITKSHYFGLRSGVAIFGGFSFDWMKGKKQSLKLEGTAGLFELNPLSGTYYKVSSDYTPIEAQLNKDFFNL